MTLLKIVVRASDPPVANSDQQPVAISISSAEHGEVDADSRAPFNAQDLSIVLRALDVDRGLSVSFAPEESEALSRWGVITTPGAAPGNAGVILGADEIHFEILQQVVTQRLYDALFPTERARSILGQALDQTPAHEVLHIRLETPSEGAGNLILSQHPWELLSTVTVGDGWAVG